MRSAKRDLSKVTTLIKSNFREVPKKNGIKMV